MNTFPRFLLLLLDVSNIGTELKEKYSLYSSQILVSKQK
jgi:hypothetical protein